MYKFRIIVTTVFSLFLLACQPQVKHPPNGYTNSLEALEDAISYTERLQKMPDSVGKALEKLEAAISRSDDNTIKRYKDSIAYAYRHIGNVFIRIRDYEVARTHYRKGLSFEPGGSARGGLYHNLAATFYNDREFQQSLVCFDSALLAKPAFPDSPYYFSAARFLGKAYLELNQPHLAQSYLEKAMALAVASGDKMKIGRACESMSIYWRLLQNYPKAIAVGQQGIAAFDDSGNLKTSGKRVLADCYQNIGNAWQDSLLRCQLNTSTLEEEWKAGEQSERHYEKARKIYEELEGLKMWEIQQTLLSNMGELYRRQGKLEKANEILEEAIAALDTVREIPVAKYSLLGKLYINRGEALMNAGKLSLAESDFDSALYYLLSGYLPAQGQQLLGLNEPTVSPVAVIMAIGNMAELAKQKARDSSDPNAHVLKLKIALEFYDSLSAFIHSTRKGYLYETDKIALSQKTRPYLDSAFLLSLELETLDPGNAQAYREQAFRFAEQSKAMALLESLQEKSWSARLDERQQQQMAELKRERTAINNEIFQYRGNPQIQEALNKRWLAHLSKWRNFQESVSYAAAQAARAMNRSVEELREKVLGEGQALLAYHEIDTVLYVFLLGKDDLQLAEVPIGKDFYPNIALFEQLLSQPPSDSLKEKEAVFCAVSKRLYDQLLPAGLRRTLPIRLIVVPSDGLQTLPFEALWTSEEKGALDSSKQAEKHYLLFRHSFSYTPSANLLYEMRNNRANAKRPARVSILAPDFSNGRSLGDEGGAAQYVPLPNQDEAKAISKNVAAVKRLGPKANKDNFWNDCQAYPVLHIPTHGILSSDPRFNRIVLSSADKLAPSRYEYLHLHELYSHSERLDLDLLTLPACETGQGASMKGEGKMSIARGLAALGIRSFVVAYWKINAYNSQELMPLFYGELAQPSNRFKDEALAQAKRDFIAGSSSHVHPFKWAGLMLIGDTDPVDLRRSNRSLVAYLWLLILPIVGGFLTRKRRSLQAVA